MLLTFQTAGHVVPLRVQAWSMVKYFWSIHFKKQVLFEDVTMLPTNYINILYMKLYVNGESHAQYTYRLIQKYNHVELLNHASIFHPFLFSNRTDNFNKWSLMVVILSWSIVIYFYNIHYLEFIYITNMFITNFIKLFSHKNQKIFLY